jgi:hypothetical protein
MCEHEALIRHDVTAEHVIPETSVLSRAPYLQIVQLNSSVNWKKRNILFRVFGRLFQAFVASIKGGLRLWGRNCRAVAGSLWLLGTPASITW